MIKAIIVDDENLSIRMLESIISWNRCGIELVATANAGDKALELIFRLQPELVITDIRMPGMDGLELIRRAKLLKPDIEFVIVSAYADFDYAKRAIALSGANYLLKPVDEAELEKTVLGVVKKLDERHEARCQLEDSRRQNDAHTLSAYMQSAAGHGKAQKSAERLRLNLDSYYLMAFTPALYETEAMEQDACPLDFHLPYLEASLTGRLQKQTRSFLFGFVESSWIIAIQDISLKPEQLARETAEFFADELKVQLSICFTAVGCGLNALPTMYRSLEKLRRYQRFIGCNGVMGYGYNCTEDARAMDGLTGAKKEMEVLIRRGDIEAAQTLLDKALVPPLYGSPAIMPLIYDFCYDVICILRDVAGKNTPLGDVAQKYTLTYLTELHTLEDLRGLLLYLLQAAFNHGATDSSCGTLVEKGIAYLKKHYSRNITLEELCAALGVSKSYFCYLFKKETGQNIWTYLTAVRLERAKELLRTTNEKTYAIAYQVGYDNPSYFSKLFKKQIGVTPNDYRRNPFQEPDEANGR